MSTDQNEWTINDQGFDLEDRLLRFASGIIKVAQKLPEDKVGKHIATQLLRAGTAPLSNHAEAGSAESREDFIHKMKICHKELRETVRWLKLIQMEEMMPLPQVKAMTEEGVELTKIFYASIRTAQHNLKHRSEGDVY